MEIRTLTSNTITDIDALLQDIALTRQRNYGYRMGLFNFFSKEKRETLDKGLSKTKESVFGKIARVVAGKSKVDDEVLDNLEEVLVTSDVGVETTLFFL